MRLQINSEVQTPSQVPKEEDRVDLDGVIPPLIASRERVFQKAEGNITSAQKQQKETYDRKHLPGEIAKVLLENTAQKQTKGGKLEPAG